MSCHYELEVGSHVFCEDLVAHAKEEKENIFLGTSGSVLTATTLSRAVFELFGVNIKKSHKRKEAGSTNVKKIFKNLKRKAAVDCIDNDESGNQESNWDKLCSNMLEIACSADGDWRVVFNQNSISCLCFDEELRFDRKRAVYEVVFKASKSDNAVEINMMYDHRQVLQELIEKVDVFCAQMSLVDKAKHYLTIFKNSPICCGFPIIGMEEKHDKFTEVEKHILSSNQSEEERWFSVDCEVITSNPQGKLCTKCCEEKKRTTRRLATDHTLKPCDVSKFCNYRFMSREQLIGKITFEREQANEEKKTRMALEEELIAMDEEDHHDLVQVMGQVEKKDVPQDMQLLWDQQEKIAKTKSKTKYRWHPR